MRKEGLALRSSSKANIEKSVDRQAKSKRKREKDRKQVKAQLGVIYNKSRHEERLQRKVYSQDKVIASLQSQLDKCSNEKEELKNRLESSENNACGWEGEAKEQKAEVKRKNRCIKRFDGRLERAKAKAAEAAKVSSDILEIKDECGVIKDSVREAIADLVGVENISAKSSFPVFKKCATLAGKVVIGSWDRRSVPRIMHEVTQAAEMMIVERVLDSAGLSLSGDGASHNNIQFSSRHITTVPTKTANHPQDSFMGVHPELNHTTSTQLEGWKDAVERFCASYNSHPDAKCVVDPASVWQCARGYLGDHAPDQKKLSVQLEDFRQECDRELRGEEAMLSDDPRDVAERDRLFDEKLEEMFEKAGGKELWSSLSPTERLRWEKETVRDVQIALGELAYERLSPEERVEVDFWVYTGCTMHKDLNAMKGGAERMAKSWEEKKQTPPVALMSKAEETAAESGPAPQKGKSGRPSDRGGTKLTSLLGALVKHKNPKKGHQARFRVYCLLVLGFEILFPDTSNNRYQSHGRAATEIVYHRQLYIDFLQNVQDQKATKGGLNHMEENILTGLLDDATFTELQVLALYSQAISLPLSQLARAPYHQSRNGLDLAEDYNRLLKHLGDIVENPDILIGPNVSPSTATFDGQMWHNPDMIAIILRERSRYPHLRSALVAFFEGALETWETFTRDVLGNPTLLAATPEQRYMAFRRPANDLNEGALGLLRRSYRAFPRITFGQLNARLMCRLNPDAIQRMAQMSPEARQHLRKVARQRDASRANVKFRLAQAEADISEARERRDAAEKAKAKAVARQELLEAFKPTLNLKKLRESGPNGFNVKQIKAQLSWHRKIGNDIHIPTGFHGLKKELAWGAMVRAVRRHLKGTSADEVDSEEFTDDKDLFGSILVSLLATDQAGANKGSDDSEEALLNHIVLNDYPVDDAGEDDSADDNYNDEDEGNDYEDDGIDVDEGEAIDEMEIDEQIGKPTPPHEEHETPVPFQAGCAWVSQNWSCAYDAAVMVFFSIYWHSSFAWRDEWRQQSPEWAGSLADWFNTIIEALDPSEYSPEGLSALLSSLRDQFRKKLSNYDPQKFPCSGQVPASVCAILELLFGSIHGPGIDEHLVCVNCGETSQTSHNFPLLALPVFRRNFRLETDPQFIPSATLLERYINSLTIPSTSSLCMACLHETTQVRHLSMPNFPWIWFELNRNSTMSPSPTVTIELPGQHLTYDLHAVVYLGGTHFTARMRDPSGEWWAYDGMWEFGAARRDSVRVPTDLLYHGSRSATFLIYRRSNG